MIFPQPVVAFLILAALAGIAVAAVVLVLLLIRDYTSKSIW